MQKTENIDLKIKLSGLKHCGGLDLLIEEFLHVLQARLPISSARVVLEQQRDTTPAYRVFAHLAVPGPDNLVTLPVEFDASRRAKLVLAKMGFIQSGPESAAVGQVLQVDIRGRTAPAEVVGLPFYSRNS